MLGTVVVALVLSAFAASGASAVQRYTSPHPANPIVGACTVGDPCGFFTAVQGASDGDEVIVEPGTYAADTGPVNSAGNAISIHGIAGQSRPVIAMNSPDGLVLDDPRSHVSDLELDNHAGPALKLAGGLAERLLVVAANGCELSAGTLRDSVCVATADAGAAVRFAGTAAAPAALRNVTAISQGTTGFGIDAAAADTSDTVLSVVNSIMRGAGADIYAHRGSGSVAVKVRASNYTTTFSVDTFDARVFDFGGRQTAAPVFVDPAHFDYHEVAGSPTVRAGVTDPSDAGTFDVDGEPRARAGFTDIGADEFPVPVPGPPVILPPPPPPPVGDRTAPVVSKASFSVSAFVTKARAGSKPHVHYRASVGFSLSELASVRGTVLVKKGHRWVSAGTAFSKRLKKGKTTLVFSDKLGHTTLKPGTYRLQLVATDAAKNRSRATTLTLKVVAR